jgi:hypothetical protein
MFSRPSSVKGVSFADGLPPFLTLEPLRKEGRLEGQEISCPRERMPPPSMASDFVVEARVRNMRQTVLALGSLAVVVGAVGRVVQRGERG